MSGLVVIHETKNACEFVEAEITGLSLPFAMVIFGVPMGKEEVTIPGHEVCVANRASQLRFS